MHEVLEGTASGEETEALQLHLADDADAREEFASWQAMFAGLARMPKDHPPEGLVAAIVAAMPVASAERASKDEIFLESNQLFSSAPVLPSGTARTTRTPFGFKTISSWLAPASSRESFMNTQRKFIVGGVVAIAALGTAVLLTNNVPTSQDVVGTVVPAERYRAPQSGAEAVKLGGQGTTSSTAVIDGSPAAASAQNAAENSAQNNAQNNAQLNAAQNNAQLNAAQNNAQLNAAQNSAQLNAAQSSAQNSAQMNAAQNSAQMNAAQNSAQLNAAQNSAQLNAAQGSAQNAAQNSAENAAQQNARNSAQFHALQNSAQSAAQNSAQNAAQNAAQNNAQNAAEKVSR